MIRSKGLVAAAVVAVNLLAAQQLTRGTRCTDGNAPQVELGWSISCTSCTVSGEADDRRWSFRAEPVVDVVDARGPLGSAVRAGDIVVAIDGHLVTTAEGGRRFGRLTTGTPAELTLLRAGRFVTVTAEPRVGCHLAEDPPPESTPGPGRPSATLPAAGRMSDGYLGLGISARASLRNPANGPPEWHFIEAPTVSGVAAGGPAALAGLEVGDTLTHVDGTAITSDEGGRRFGAIRPGQTVRFGVRGARGSGVVAVRATERPADKLAEAVAALDRVRDRAARLGFAGNLDGVAVEVTGPASIERVGDRMIVRTHDGSVTVVVRATASR